MMDEQYMGVRAHYVGHGEHTVATCVHRTTEENKRACLEAIAILEGITVAQLQDTLARERATIKIDLYRAS